MMNIKEWNAMSKNMNYVSIVRVQFFIGCIINA